MVELTRGEAVLISAAGVYSPERAESAPAPGPIAFRTFPDQGQARGIMLGLDDFIQRPLNALTGLFGSVNDRKIKAKQPMVVRINGLEPEF
jgi:hypothetical protein